MGKSANQALTRDWISECDHQGGTFGRITIDSDRMLPMLTNLLLIHSYLAKLKFHFGSGCEASVNRTFHQFVQCSEGT